MYAYISGTVDSTSKDSIVVDNHGIGYRIFVPSSVSGTLKKGDECRIYTHFSVREDAMQLFGFLTEDDLEIYRLLIGVSGVGPKSALGVLSVLTADDLRFAVLSDDAAVISKAPGIGKKTAQKILLELKDKLNLEEAFESKSLHTEEKSEAEMNAAGEAQLALVALGYTNAEASKAVKKAASEFPGADTQDLIKLALREL